MHSICLFLFINAQIIVIDMNILFIDIGNSHH
jgi:hypothetical protein